MGFNSPLPCHLHLKRQLSETHKKTRPELVGLSKASQHHTDSHLQVKNKNKQTNKRNPVGLVYPLPLPILPTPLPAARSGRIVSPFHVVLMCKHSTHYSASFGVRRNKSVLSVVTAMLGTEVWVNSSYLLAWALYLQQDCACDKISTSLISHQPLRHRFMAQESIFYD